MNARQPKTFKPRIALLYSPETPDEKEQRFGNHCSKALHYAGCHTSELDYHSPYFNLSMLRAAAKEKADDFSGEHLEVAFKKARGPVNIGDYAKKRAFLEKHFFEKNLDMLVVRWLHENGIDGVFAPGDYYDVVPPNTNKNPDRKDIEEACIRITARRKIPYMGVCGGMQRYVHSIGGQVRDIEPFARSEVHLCSLHNNVHSVRLAKSKLRAAYESAGREPRVNSHHIQGTFDTPKLRALLARHKLQIAARSEEDISTPLVEAIENIPANRQFVLLTQYHPETMQNTPEMKSFVEAARNYDKAKTGRTRA